MAKRKTTKRRAKRNPSKVRRYAKKASSSVARSFMGLNFRKVLKEVPYTQLGMFSTKWAAKRFGPDASETDPNSWDYLSYIKGAAGGVVMAMLLNSFRNSAAAHCALSGSVNYLVFKMIQNEFIQNSDQPWVVKQFGADEYVPDEYMVQGTNEDPYMYGQDGNIYPADDRHRLPEVSGYGSLEPVGPLGSLEPVGPLGDPWAQSFTL